MQFEPDAPTLLAAIARLLDEQVLIAVSPELQHQVRVAGHLAHLVERELRLGPGSAAAERQLLAELLGGDDSDRRLADLVAALAERIRTADDVELERRVWPALVAVTRADLAIAKPGHDAWEGE